jgi:hypothetical protein
MIELPLYRSGDSSRCTNIAPDYDKVWFCLLDKLFHKFSKRRITTLPDGLNLKRFTITGMPKMQVSKKSDFKHFFSSLNNAYEAIANSS